MKVCLSTATKAVAAAVLMVSLSEAMDFGDEEVLLSIYGDEQIISLAAGYLQPISKAPSVASVITASEIKRIGATSLDEVLQVVPGLHVSRDSLGYNPVYTFRGMHASFNPQVLMLVNGVPQTNLFHGDRGLVWGGFPVETIDRIEIIRGPGSALFGADAFAGTINIITRNAASAPGFNAGYRGGSYSTHEAWVHYGGELLGGGLFVALELGKSDVMNERIAADAQSVLDSETGTSASLAPGGVNLDRKFYDFRTEYNYDKYTFRLSHQYRESENGAGVALALDPNNVFASNRTLLQLVYEEPEWRENLSVRIEGSFFRSTQEVKKDLIVYPPGSTAGLDDGPLPEGLISNPEVYERHYRFHASSSYTGFFGHNVSVGTGYYYGDLYQVKEYKNFGFISEDVCLEPGSSVQKVQEKEYLFLPPGSRKNYFLYIQDAWQVADDWELTAGVRYDHYSDFGSTTNPRVALVWTTSHNLSTKLLYGEAFRAPAFAQTRAANNPSILGNPNLDPETLSSYELAFDYRPRYDLNLLFNLFHYKWKDIINFVPDANEATRTAQNAGEQIGRGFEFEANWKVTPDWTLSTNFSYTRAEDKLTGSKAADFPVKQLYLRSFWELDRGWSVNLQASHVADRRRSASDPRRNIDDYTLVDLTLRKRVSNSVELALLVKNLFDEEAREPTPMGDPVPLIPGDLPLPGRTVLGELRFSF